MDHADLGLLAAPLSLIRAIFGVLGLRFVIAAVPGTRQPAPGLHQGQVGGERADVDGD